MWSGAYAIDEPEPIARVMVNNVRKALWEVAELDTARAVTASRDPNLVSRPAGHTGRGATRSMAKMERRYSQISARTLQRLDSLETTYDEMAAAVSEIKLALDAGVSREDLLSVKHRLAQLNGDLEKFQFTKIDAVETSELNSGKTDAKAHRKARNQRRRGDAAAHHGARRARARSRGASG